MAYNEEHALSSLNHAYASTLSRQQVCKGNLNCEKRHREAAETIKKAFEQRGTLEKEFPGE